MKRFTLVIAGLLWACSGMSAQSFDYRITAYTASFELIGGSPDVLVTLRITYRIGNLAKSDGFKYVSGGEVTDLRCTDEGGRALASRVVSERETRLEWRFPEVRQADQTVSVQFRMRNILRSRGDYVVFDAPWTGVFRVPVENAVYELIIPGADRPILGFGRPAPFRLESAERRWKVIASQAILREQGFNVQFHGSGFAAASFASAESETLTGWIILAVLFAGISLLVVAVVKAAKKRGKSAGDWTGRHIGESAAGGCGGGGCGGGCGG